MKKALWEGNSSQRDEVDYFSTMVGDMMTSVINVTIADIINKPDVLYITYNQYIAFGFWLDNENAFVFTHPKAAIIITGKDNQ